MRKAGRAPGARQAAPGAADDLGDGQAASRRDGRGREVRLGLPLLRRARRAVPGRRAGRRPTRRRATSATSRSGPVLAVMPWNFPFWQVFRFAAPGADGGQRRPAQARLQRARSARWRSRTSSARAGFPEGVFQTLLIGSDQVRAACIDDPRVAAVTLTGSDAGGQPGRRGRRASASRRPCSSWAAATRSS